jgi:hypothetical protein
MNAETPAPVELSLPEAFLLLATNDHDGKPEIPVFALRTTLAGAILGELDMQGAIELQGKHLRATGATPKTELRRELEVIRHKSRPHTPKRWVSMLESRGEVQRVYERMVSLGIVEPVGEKHLGFFRTVRYPEKDHGPEAALLKKLEAALNGSSTDAAVPASAAADAGATTEQAADAGPSDAATPDAVTPGAAQPDAAGSGAAKPGGQRPDDRTLALIALLHAAGLLHKLFPAADRIWADELAKEYWPARAVEDELRMIRLAEEEAPAL